MNSFNNYGTIQRSRKPTSYRDGKAARTLWCVQCGIERQASPSVGKDEDDQPACQQHVVKGESAATTPPEPAEQEAV